MQRHRPCTNNKASTTDQSNNSVQESNSLHDSFSILKSNFLEKTKRKMTSTTTATANEEIHQDSSERSCSALDLSWLSESVLEAALNTHNLSIQDVTQFHDSLRAAEEYGSMDRDTSERLHEKIQKKETALLDRLVAHETARVSRKLGIYSIFKNHKTWEQVHYMADMHGQGAYILMKVRQIQEESNLFAKKKSRQKRRPIFLTFLLLCTVSFLIIFFIITVINYLKYVYCQDFQGLSKDDVREALTPFHEYLDEHSKDDGEESRRPIPLPFSTPEEAKFTKIDETARPKVLPRVAKKLCKAYRRLHASMHDKETGGYDDEFLMQVFRDGSCTPERLCDLLQVELSEEGDDEGDEKDLLGEGNSDDEEEDEEEEHDGRHERVRAKNFDDDFDERY